MANVLRKQQTCLMSHFGMTKANPQKQNFAFAFLSFFSPPPNFFEKGKGKFCFCGSP